MGEDVLEEKPEVEPAKFYCIRTEKFWDPVGDQGCGGTLFSVIDSCNIGWAIQAWWDSGNECVNFWRPDWGLWVASKISSVKGPYDTHGECAADC